MTQFQTQAKLPSTTTTAPAPSGTRLLQRKCACGGSAGLTGECEECRKEKLLGTNAVRLQKKLATGEPGDQYEQEANRMAEQVTGGHVSCAEDSRSGHAPQIQRQAAGPVSTTDIPSLVHEALNSEGRPLDSGTRGFFEGRFGHDFGQVRVHTGARATRSAQMLGALAYTVGHDIVLGPGQYAPETAAGRRLLAHELTHVVQQGRAVRMAAQTKLRVSDPEDAAEREANHVAHHVMVGLPSRVAEMPSADVMCLDDGSLTSEQPITLPTEELHHTVPNLP